jgi:hypothetical protein
MPADGYVELADGVTLNFHAGSYQTGDSWTVEADSIGADQVELIPQNLLTVAGSADGVTLGDLHDFSGTSDSATIMSAAPGSGFGQYQATPLVSLTVPPRAPVGAYSATLTETLD